MATKRYPLIAGNWKMHKTLVEAKTLAQEICAGMQIIPKAEIVLAPPFTALAAVAQVLAGTKVKLSAQDTFWEKQGAYTGAISPVMLQDVGCQYVIIGHSERRQYFGETNATVNRKIKAVLGVPLTPLMCIGETLAQRESGDTLTVIAEQLEQGCQGLAGVEAEKLVIAYEPVWAIGTGRTATPGQAQEVHAFIRQKLITLFGAKVAESTRILYGGSVTPENIAVLIREPDIDGALVGGASLKAASFLAIAALGT
jgi:triosephosphate isomerase (TIM)